MAVDYATWTRMGASLLYVLLGLFLLLRPPRTKDMALWGAAYVADGASRVYSNVTFLMGAREIQPIDSAVFLVSGGLFLVFVILLTRATTRDWSAKARKGAGWITVGFLLLVTFHFFTGESAPPWSYFASLGPALGVLGAFTVWLVGGMTAALGLVLLENLRRGGSPRARAWLLAGFPLVAAIPTSQAARPMFSLFYDAEQLQVVYETFTDLIFVAILVAPMAYCFRLMGGPHSVLARNVLLGFYAWMFAWFLYIVDIQGLPGTIPGVLRILSLGTIGYAILYGAFLPKPLARPTVRRGFVAGVALAALFTTAQVAQNFLSDYLGLLMGGLVAGFMVFAAFPLQRAAERRLGSGPGADEPFRRAARIALKDRILSAEEERDLIDLAHRLGLDPRRAFAILDEERAVPPVGTKQRTRA